MNIRLRKFLIELDAWVGSNSYYDEDTGETVIDGTENECYNHLMQTDEFHLLGEKLVKDLIHTAFTNYEEFAKLQRKHNAYA